MKLHLRLVHISCLLLLTVAVARAAPAQAVPTFDVRPFETLGLGSKSGCLHPARLVLGDEAQWRRVWTLHNGSDAGEPTVDFSRQVVLVILLGRQSGPTPHHAVEVAQIVSTPVETVVYYAVDADGQAAKPGPGELEPFHFIATDRPKTPIRFSDIADPVCLTCGH